MLFLCIERFQTLTIKTKLFAKLHTSNKIILFVKSIHYMKKDYDVNFQIMILGYILSGSQSGLKRITVLIKDLNLNQILTHSRSRRIENRHVPKSTRHSCVCRAIVFLLQNQQLHFNKVLKLPKAVAGYVTTPLL